MRLQPNADACNRNGDLVCGGCQCKPGWMGKTCDCDVSKGVGHLDKKCKQHQGSPSLCNGRGECICGKCKCLGSFFGKFCECNRDDCPKMNGKVCGGNGECLCNNQLLECKCNAGWTGRDCTCTKDTTGCKSRLDSGGSVCLGRGRCECGECICNEGYEGNYCQRTVGFDTCAKIKPCVRSAILRENATKQEINGWDEECGSNIKINGVQQFDLSIERTCKVPEVEGEEPILAYEPGNDDCNSVMRKYQSQDDQIKTFELKSLIRCTFDYDDCVITFYHDQLEGDAYFDPRKPKMQSKVLVLYRKHENFWTPTNSCEPIPMAVVLAISAGIFAFIILIILVAICIAVNVRDHRAWKKYLARREANERAMMGVNMNPLYQSTDKTATGIMNHNHK